MYLKQYVHYIQNTGVSPLKAVHFDEDWEPIGPKLRQMLVGDNLAFEDGGFIALTKKGRELIGVSTEGEI